MVVRSPYLHLGVLAARVIFLPMITVDTNRQENPTHLLMMTIQEFV